MVTGLLSVRVQGGQLNLRGTPLTVVKVQWPSHGTDETLQNQDHVCMYNFYGVVQRGKS